MTASGDVVPTTSIDDPRGSVIRRGRRETSSSATTSEVGVLRVDGIPLQNGRIYTLVTNNLFFASTVALDVIVGRLRFNAAGTATTASTIIGEGGNHQPSAIAYGSVLWLPFIPATTANYSILLSVARIGGSGSVSIGVTANHPTIDLLIFDGWVDPGDVGVDV